MPPTTPECLYAARLPYGKPESGEAGRKFDGRAELPRLGVRPSEKFRVDVSEVVPQPGPASMNVQHGDVLTRVARA